MWRPALVMVFLLLAVTASAQAPDQPIMGSSGMGDVAAVPTTGQLEARRVLVLGDGVGGGLGAGLLRAAATDPGLDVVSRFNEESGLARPEVYDWAATAQKILEGATFDVIVVMLGANDRQTIRDGELRQPFGSEGWAAAYRKQADRLLDALQASGARVIWVSLPPLKDPDYDAAVRAITALQRERVEARGMTFLDLRPQLSGADGGFAETVQDASGTVVKLRGRDGISFFKAGNNLMAQLVLAALANTAPTPAAEAAITAPEDPGVLRNVPVFGRTLADGGFYTVQPEGVTANAMLLAAGLSPDAALKTLRDVSPADSGAEQLFRFGAPQTAPPGRADDFAAPPGATE
ncbi:MAG: DUF459 domain-containing protein [Aestuariivirga sp.]|uniref:SGNH/GDSL hydrolase family protein n=1 Tax=Aestuariivirga sp. TaxID=2650926 RepID=UPI0038D2399B